MGAVDDITAILPLKNFHPGFLRTAIESVRRQTSPAWQLKIVVEAEDRGRFEQQLAWCLADDRVELLTNRGRKLAGAINSGMLAASTRFAAILLGDDRWAPEAVETLRRSIAAEPATDFFHSARQVVDEQDRIISRVYPARRSFELHEFAFGSPVKHLLCWRVEMGLAVGGVDETLNSVGPDDWDFPWVMAEHGARFSPLEQCLYLYRDHREAYRLTTHLPLSHHRREIERILRKHGVSEDILRQRLERAEDGFLRQCLYRNPFDRWWKRLRGHDPRRGWRERYER